MNLCDYGCGQEAKFYFKNGKKCCSKSASLCSKIKIKNSETNKIKQSGQNNAMYGKKHTIESKRKISKGICGKNLGKYHSEETKEKIRSKLKGRIYSEETKERMKFGSRKSIVQINERHPLFFKIEELRYNPDKPGENEIQVHCKYSECQNSKEKGGWFTPTRSQIAERIRHIEYSSDGCYFYCSNKCKSLCPLYNLKNDPFDKKEINSCYTQYEYQIFRKQVLERDNYICQFCGEKAVHVHHERPQKLEPFFALDPDFAWSCCEKCHYEKGHKQKGCTIKDIKYG